MQREKLDGIYRAYTISFTIRIIPNHGVIMNILFFGKKREGKGVHEYQRHIIRNMPVKNQEECYARKLMMDNQTYVFDRFDDMGNAVFVDDQWDEEEEYKPQPYGSFADLKESFYIPKWAEKLYGTPV